MRQAGVIAAAAIVALEEMQERLADDHSNARLLAAGLEAVHGLQVRAADVETNIVYVRVDEQAFGMREVELQKRLKDAGIAIGVSGVGIVRMVTHYEITEQDVQRVIDAVVDIGKLKPDKQ
jgi:threonine aldolase